ncbi:MAG: hypothetical protein ACRENO_05105, partial [Thermodesulfobacteriota bacterium]
RLYLPESMAAPSKLTVKQKIHHMNHGLGYLNIAIGFLLTPISLITIVSMIYHKEIVEVPSILIASTLLYTISGTAFNFIIYMKIMGCSLKDTLGAIIASRSLNHTYIAASTLCLFKNEIPWHRTSKFKSLPLGLNALGAAKTEILMGLVFLSFSVVVLTMLPEIGLHFFLAIGLLARSADYFIAPAMAVLAEYDLKSKEAINKSQITAQNLAFVGNEETPKQ